MQHATDAVRRPARPPLTHASAINAANDIASTNSTSNRFLGASQRSWMSSGTGTGIPKPLSARQNTLSDPTPSTTNPLSSAASPPPLPANRPLPTYRFLPAIPQTHPEDATRTNAAGRWQHEEPCTSGLEPASINGSVSKEPGDVHKAGTTRARTTPEHELAVVDLTLSQPDQTEHEHEPMESDQDRTPTLLHAQELEALTRINTSAASDASASAASSNPVQQSLSLSTSANRQAPVPATFARPPSTQLLTPAASPLAQYNDQLQRKRPSLDIPSLQYPQTRLRTESPTISPGTRLHSPPHDQFSQQQLPNFIQPPQPVRKQSIPQQAPSASLPPSHQLVHGSANSRNGSRPVVLQPHRASIIGPNPPLAGRGQSYLATFDTTIAEMSTRINLSDRAQLRLPWIRDACQNDDLFFLLLNQLLCTWHFNKDLLVPLGINSTCDAGFRTLELLFASNSDLPQELLAFLAGWPNSPYSLKANAELNQWVINIGHFLPQLSARWDDFRQLCIQRRCPPTAREVTDAFRCPPSAVLPRAIFSSLARQTALGYPPEFYNAAYDLFRTNQNDYFAAIFSRRLDCSLAQDYTAFATQYGHLLEQHWRRLSGAVVLSSAPPSLPRPSIAQAKTSQSSFTSPSQRTFPGLVTAPQNSASSNQGLIDSIARGGAASSPVDSFPAETAAQRVRASVDSGRGMLHNRTQTSPVVQPSSNSMGPIRSNFARTNLQSLSTAGSQASPASYRTTNHAQSSRTQIVRPNLPPHPAQPLLPDPRNLPPFLTNPIPEQEALHLAHLREPQTEVKSVKPGETPRLYQSVQYLALGPHVFTPEMAFFEVSFPLLPDVVGRKAEIIQPSFGSFDLPKRILSTDLLLFNMRCIQLKADQEVPDESDWAALPTYFPQHIFISINDEHLEIRRKRQFRKDLPIDVTPFVKAGENKVTVSIHGEKGEEGKTFALAVEVIGLQDHSQALKMPTKIVAEEAKKSITSSMQPAADGDDDDMQVVTDNIILSITDPFLSSLFTIPVKGKKCKHRECFDLETFLQSRVSDNKDALTSVYEWRCPTCGKDARPKSLVIDGFMQQVRDRLVEAGNTDARAIVIEKDGSWMMKQEVDQEAVREAFRGGSRQLGMDRSRSEGQSSVAPEQSAVMPQAPPGGAVTCVNAVLAASRVIEVIELDDD